MLRRSREEILRLAASPFSQLPPQQWVKLPLSTTIWIERPSGSCHFWLSKEKDEGSWLFFKCNFRGSLTHCSYYAGHSCSQPASGGRLQTEWEVCEEDGVGLHLVPEGASWEHEEGRAFHSSPGSQVGCNEPLIPADNKFCPGRRSAAPSLPGQGRCL